MGAGKTGTAQKSVSGGYKTKLLFASVFPASAPKYVLIVVLDEPKPNKDYIYEYKDGSGWKIKGTQLIQLDGQRLRLLGK